MKRHTRWKSVGKASLFLAAAATFVGGISAQEATPRLTPLPAQQDAARNKQQPITREVNLSVDGTIRVAVVTRSGYYVGGARVALTRMPNGLPDGTTQVAATDRQPEQQRIITAQGGPSVLMGIKPGTYQVRVEVRQTSSEAILLVKAAAQDSGRAGQTQVLLPSPDDDNRVGTLDGDSADDDSDPSRRRAGAVILGGAGLASAIALPISLQHHGRRRASP